MPDLIAGNTTYTAHNVISSAIDVCRTKANLLNSNLSSKDVAGHVTCEASVVSNGAGGIKIAGLQQRVQENVIAEVRKLSGQVCCTEATDQYYKDILAFFGTKGDQSSLAHIGGEMSSALKSLQSQPGNSILRTDALRGLMDHAKSIRDLSSKISNLQGVIGLEITKSVDVVNKNLSAVVDLTQKIKDTKIEEEAFGFIDQRRLVYQALAEQLSIRIDELNPKQLLIFDANENTLLQGNLISSLSYSDTNDVSSLTINIFDSRVIDISATIQENNQTGRLAGLKRMHDTVLPNIQEQLDEYTRALRDKFNDIHNLGISSNPPSTLTGSIGVPGISTLTSDSVISGVGTVRIATADPVTGNLSGYSDINLTDNMTIQQLMDSINNAIPSSGVTASITTDGRFQLQSTDSSLGVVIGSVGSQVASLSASSVYAANMSANMSHFFGLNNLFETGTQSLGDPIGGISALFSVRQDIIDSFGKNLACGKLNSNPILTPPERVLNNGDVDTISLLATAYNDSDTVFNQTALSPAIKTSLSSFSDNMIDIQNRDVERVSIRLKNERSVYTNMSIVAHDISGVNEKKVLFDIGEIDKLMDALSKAMIMSNKINEAIMSIK